MAAIFKRETKSYYTGMVGYVTAAVSLFFLGLYFTNRNLMYASSDFASVLYTTTLIMLFLLPAISMRSFAEDRRNKTDQLLLTSPVSIPGIVLGKFLAEVVVFALPLTVAVIMPLILTAFGTVSLVSGVQRTVCVSAAGRGLPGRGDLDLGADRKPDHCLPGPPLARCSSPT